MAATIIVLAVVVVIVALAIRKLVRDKKSGNACSQCTGGCNCCSVDAEQGTK